MKRNLWLMLAVSVGIGSFGCASNPPPPPPPPPQPQPVAEPTPPPPQQPVGPGVVTAAPTTGGTGSVGSIVSPTWTATGYNVGDFVSNHMTLRARQYANGFMAITELVRGNMRHGERRHVQAGVRSGHCYRIIGVGGSGVRDLDLYLRGPGGVLIDQDRAPDNFPVIGLDRQICIPQGMGDQFADLEIVMARGEGEIGVQVFGSP